MPRGRCRFRRVTPSSTASWSSDDDYGVRPTHCGSRRDRSLSIDIPLQSGCTRSSEIPLAYSIEPVERHRSRIHQIVERANNRGRRPDPWEFQRPSDRGRLLSERDRLLYRRDPLDEELARLQLEHDSLLAQRGCHVSRLRDPSPTSSNDSDSSYCTTDSDSINSGHSHHCECCRYNIQGPPPYAPAQAEATEEGPRVASVEQVEDYDDDIPNDTAAEVPDTRPAPQAVERTPKSGKISRFTEGDMS